jgi:hypothetical protein
VRFGRKAPSDKPALKPYWGKLAVRNFRGGAGNAMQGWLSFATPLERVDTLETTDLHVGAPVLYSMDEQVDVSVQSHMHETLNPRRHVKWI